jgi:hypothetical protein
VWFYGGSFAALSAGMLGGFWYTLKREGVKSLSYQTHGTPALVASRALFYGTVLCVGTFAGVGSVFVATTGISSFKEFHEAATRTTQKVDFLPKDKDEVKKEKDFVKMMNEEEEMSYFYNKVFPEGEGGGDVRSGDGKVGDGDMKEED